MKFINESQDVGQTHWTELQVTVTYIYYYQVKGCVALTKYPKVWSSSMSQHKGQNQSTELQVRVTYIYYKVEGCDILTK